ncbi:HNH endonuclease signature motif containing protein [Xenorhabdus bovienii]|uniref:HNH endonuclease signature motif containing protein n=1 Tax=Xenorhabdus bovienii TaxID=40576 RepID=UPI00068F6FAB|nr:HNH endonuclease signature motif containing protein [Xenorhabdus bovienii]
MITQSELKSMLSYDPETGLFTWIKRNSNRVKIGDIAGSVNDNGYIDIRIHGRLMRAHRLAWLYMHGEWPREVIDHINGVRDDNRISNLRDVSHSINMLNTSEKSSSKSGYRGVSWCHDTKKWRAKIQIGDKYHHLGRYHDIEDALQAYKKAKNIVIKQRETA